MKEKFKQEQEVIYTINNTNTYIHSLMAKHGKKILLDKKGNINPIALSEFITRIRLLLNEHCLHDTDKMYPCRNTKFILKHENNDSYTFLERLINLCNQPVGRFITKSFLKILLEKPEVYLVEILKVLTHCRHISKEDIHITLSNLPNIFVDNNGKKYTKNLALDLYYILSRGGKFYYKHKAILCLKSLFYTRRELKETDLSSDIYKRIPVLETFSIVPLPLHIDTIYNLCDLGYINKTLDTMELYYTIEGNFYIPKKKRRHRVYLEDNKYLIISNCDTIDDTQYITRNKFYHDITKLVKNEKYIASEHKHMKIYEKKVIKRNLVNKLYYNEMKYVDAYYELMDEFYPKRY